VAEKNTWRMTAHPAEKRNYPSRASRTWCYNVRRVGAGRPRGQGWYLKSCSEGGGAQDGGEQRDATAEGKKRAGKNSNHGKKSYNGKSGGEEKEAFSHINAQDFRRACKKRVSNLRRGDQVQRATRQTPPQQDSLAEAIEGGLGGKGSRHSREWRLKRGRAQTPIGSNQEGPHVVDNP